MERRAPIFHLKIDVTVRFEELFRDVHMSIWAALWSGVTGVDPSFC